MIARRLRKVVAVIAGALAAGVPVTLIHQGVDAYIERQSAEEVRLAAQRAVAQAEWRIGHPGHRRQNHPVGQFQGTDPQRREGASA